MYLDGMQQPGGSGATMPSYHPDDSTLLEALRHGDMQPLDALHQRYLPSVYWAAFEILHDHMDAEDSAQETFLTLWRRRREIEIASSLLPWLLVTARYHALNRMRERQRRQRREVSADAMPADAMPATDGSPEESLILAEQMTTTKEAIAQLPLLDQRIYHLCLVEGRLYKEAALELGISHGAIRNRLSRIRIAVRRELSSD